MNTTLKNRLIFAFIIFVLLLISIELGGYAAITLVNSQVQKARSSGVLLDDEIDFTADQIAAYYTERHSVLGWPTKPVLNSSRHDPSGARPDPTFPYPQAPCAAAFGDSFTRSAEVTDEFAWTHQLSKLIGCRVANFGVGGYGTDQAYLRFKLTDVGPTKLVILGVFPDNILRNVNRYRGYLVASHRLKTFKPRFVVEDDKLVEVPIFNEPNMPFSQLKANPRSHLPHEFFLPGTKYGPVKIEFPYALAAIRGLIHPRSMAILRGEPSWIDFYDPAHESKGLQVTAAIIDNFVRDVEELGKIPLVYVFMNARSVETYERTGNWPYSTLLEHLRNNNIHYVHFGDELGKYLPLQDVCKIFTKSSIFGCTGHYKPDGYDFVARSIYAYLEQNEINFDNGF